MGQSIRKHPPSRRGSNVIQVEDKRGEAVKVGQSLALQSGRWNYTNINSSLIYSVSFGKVVFLILNKSFNNVSLRLLS